MFEKYKISKMPGHWFLARMGKKVLRPGGRRLTETIINQSNINRSDEVIEFAPGLGITTRMILEKKPEKYTGIDRTEEVANHINWLAKDISSAYKCINAGIEKSALPDQSATKIIGEAVLTMQSDKDKIGIIKEAFRLLNPGGLYSIHEIALIPSGLSDDFKEEVRKNLSAEIHVNARPLTAEEWQSYLEKAGFEVIKISYSPMHLLRLSRLINDEGFFRTLKISWNIVRRKDAIKRVKGMRAVFEKYQDNMQAIGIIVKKPD